MTTAYSDPNSDVAYTWGDNDPGVNHNYVDDGVRNPSQTGLDGAFRTANNADDNEPATFGGSQPSISGTVTQVTVHALMLSDGTSDITVALSAYFNGSAQASSNVTALSFTTAWYTKTYSGLSIPAASFFPCRMTIQPAAIAKSNAIVLYACYLEIEYTAGGGGGGGGLIAGGLLAPGLLAGLIGNHE